MQETRIYLFAEPNFSWMIIIDPVSESIAMGKVLAAHTGSQKEVLQDAFWNAIQQLATKPRFALPLKIYLPNKKMKKGFLTPLFNEELKRILDADYKDENIILEKYGRFSAPRKFFINLVKRHQGELSWATQRYLSGSITNW